MKNINLKLMLLILVCIFTSRVLAQRPAPISYYVDKSRSETGISVRSSYLNTIDSILDSIVVLKTKKKFKAAIDLISNNNKLFKDSFHLEIEYQKLLLTFLTDDIINLEKLIKQYNNFNSSSSHSNELNYLNVFILNEKEDYLKARDMLIKHIEALGGSDKEKLILKIKNIYKKNELKLKYQRIFQNSSIFLPGSTQYFNNQKGEGIASFLLNTGLVGLGVLNLTAGLYLTSFVLIVNIWPRFYIAGLEISKKNKNEQKKININLLNKQCLEFYVNQKIEVKTEQ